MDVGTAIFNIGLAIALIAVVAWIVWLGMKSGDWFLRILSCPACIFLGTYFMGLSTNAAFKYVGILIIVIGIYALYSVGESAWVNRHKKH